MKAYHSLNTQTTEKSAVQCRSGFTLIEILVVIGIIALLITISVTTYGFVIANANEAATKATIEKVKEALKHRMEAFNRGIKKQDKAAGDNAPAYVTNLALWRNNQRDLARALGRKQLFRTYFPQSFNEMTDLVSTKRDASTTPLSTLAQKAESAEVLYIVLTEGVSFGEDIADADFDSNKQDTDGDGLFEIVDGWGNPLRFYRWPTGLVNHADASLMIRSIPPSTVSGDTNGDDPDDSLGTIITRANADADFKTDFEDSYHKAGSWHTPLVISAGLDGELGMDEPGTDTGRLAAPQAGSNEKLLDNITNLNLTGGG